VFSEVFKLFTARFQKEYMGVNLSSTEAQKRYADIIYREIPAATLRQHCPKSGRAVYAKPGGGSCGRFSLSQDIASCSEPT
jgi:hypothetical protein